METCSRKRKEAKKNGSDYISQLSDDLLIHILSFLSTKEAVQTCLVSKRWSNLWAQVPFLDFDSFNFNSDDNFSDCVTSVLKYRGPTHGQLDTFRLAREQQDESKFKFYPPLLEWISQVLQFSPRSIFIRVCAGFKEFTLPESLFTCETLEELEITIEIPHAFVDFNSEAVKLPRLKKLHLSYVDNFDSKDMNNLLMGCPLLESLFFECCFLNFSQVSSNTLKSLVVVDCDLQQGIQFPFLELYNSF
ncbi:hypothetical protein LUZ63_004360 [Rhynchospora breviuscula]|uniref:F-box domain-containing protein n=1 Tax=Rhynchospora breviuscula TaxID=2022672 RepID=A0A9Q0D2B3_9POAL|nr:hypothetical protein LUZ63_004360 [Rhynchospora breviuscula]